jgi:hypothetical protein
MIPWDKLHGAITHFPIALLQTRQLEDEPFSFKAVLTAMVKTLMVARTCRAF